MLENKQTELYSIIVGHRIKKTVDQIDIKSLLTISKCCLKLAQIRTYVNKTQFDKILPLKDYTEAELEELYSQMLKRNICELSCDELVMESQVALKLALMRIKPFMFTKGWHHAVQRPSGIFFYNEKNLLDRDGGPAIEYNDGGKYYYKEGTMLSYEPGLRERQIGAKPFVCNDPIATMLRNQMPVAYTTTKDGVSYSYNKDNQLHNSDGPAMVGSNGTKKWYDRGVLHRWDGPAIEWHNGDLEWYVNGKKTQTKFAADGIVIKYYQGGEEWLNSSGDVLKRISPQFTEIYKHSRYHSFDDKPALINHKDGTSSWYKDGLLHRDNDLPAVVMKCGTKRWYIDGVVHRDNNKPAVIICVNNVEVSYEYWCHGKFLRREEVKHNHKPQRIRKSILTPMPFIEEH